MEHQSKGLVGLLHFAGFLAARRIVIQGEHVGKFVFPAWMRRAFKKKIKVIKTGIGPD
ncbi:MAG: hypothetical protein GTO41_25555, partial [Burkholderiales bacterium]|nr:hypothetical protein [Burkholderiales bacterium]